jgi:hypothetical protein
VLRQSVQSQLDYASLCLCHDAHAHTGPQLDVPASVAPEQLEALLNSLLQSEEKLPYSFYIQDQVHAPGCAGGHATQRCVAIRGEAQVRVHVCAHAGACRRPRNTPGQERYQRGECAASGVPAAGTCVVEWVVVVVVTAHACCLLHPTCSGWHLCYSSACLHAVSHGPTTHTPLMRLRNHESRIIAL